MTSRGPWLLRQTQRKLLGFHQTEDRFGPDFADIKHDYTQEFYRSYSSFISQCPRTGKFCGVCLGDVSNEDLSIIENNQFTNLIELAMPRVETRGSENEEESKQRCVTYEFIVWIISTFHPPLPSHRSRRVLAIPLTRVDLNIMRP